MSKTPLTDAINALISYSNSITGASDATLSEVVARLTDGYTAGVLNWKVSTLTSATMAFKGIYPDINEVIFDVDNKTLGVPCPTYLALKTTNGKITYKNVSSSLSGSQMSIGDFLRQSPCVSEVDFGGLSPETMSRWFYQWGYSQDGNHHSGLVTCRNLGLDNLKSNSNSFNSNVGGVQSSTVGTFDVYFVGQLKNTIDLSSWIMLNADSINRLIDRLYDYSEGDAHTLTLGSSLLPLVDAEHQAIAAARNWTLE